MADTNKQNTRRNGAPGKPKSEAHRAAISQAMVQHGLRAELKLGKLPSHLQYVEQRTNAFRRKLEEAIVQAKGEVSISDSAAINSACKWERHGLLAQYWLRKEADTLSVGDRLKFSSEIAKASDQRDRNIRLLGLDAQRNMWDVIDGTVKDAS